MTRLLKWARWMVLVSTGGMLLAASGCLPDQFYAGLLGDSISAATTGVAAALALKFFPGVA